MSAAARRCPVTIPTGEEQPSFGPSGFNYGSTRLRVELYWPHGNLTAGKLPDGGYMATISRDGSISAKVGWWRGTPGQLVVRGWRLDARAAPLRADVRTVAEYGPTGFVPSGVTFPTTGCWRVVGKLRNASLSFVVRVTKLEQRTRY